MERWVKDFWENEFGENNAACDFAGYEIWKESYGQPRSQYGWNIDHILPTSIGGTDHAYNLQITSIFSNSQRGNRMSFWIDGVSYQVKKISRLCNEDKVADYPYDRKKYCIVILNEPEEEEQFYHAPYDDEDDW